MTDRRRVTVTVSQELFEVLGEIGHHTHKARHAIPSDMLGPCLPPLRQLLDALLAADTARSMIHMGLATAMQNVAARVEGEADDLEAELTRQHRAMVAMEERWTEEDNG